MITTAVENATDYVFTVTSGERTFIFNWSKQAPEGQTLNGYLQSCKREAELLAQHEIDLLAPPTEIVL